MQKFYCVETRIYKDRSTFRTYLVEAEELPKPKTIDYGTTLLFKNYFYTKEAADIYKSDNKVA